MCFNGAKYYQLQWVSDKVYEHNPNANPNHQVTIKGIAKYSPTDNFNVVVKIDDPDTTNDYYMWFNAQVGINQGTKEAKNKVMIVHTSSGEGTNYAKSWIDAKLLAGESATLPFGSGGNLEVSVASITKGNGTPQEWTAVVSINYT